MKIQEVPSPIDLRNPKDAMEWANEANIKRPWRYDFFDMYAHKINNLNIENIQILDIGSGPGFLAKYLLQHCPDIRYTAADFSNVMNFHQQVKRLCKNQTVYFVCDHIFAPDAMQNNQLYMSKKEHFQSLENAGFKNIELIKDEKGLCLFECVESSEHPIP